MKLSGAPPAGRGPVRKQIVMNDLRSVSHMRDNIGAEVTDFLCVCEKPRVVVGATGKPFLGCPDYKNCDGKPVDPFVNFSVLPKDAVWENGEAVFYRDEMGEPCVPS